MSLLSLLILTKGANVGVKALYVVALIIFIALTLFFLGDNQIKWQNVDFFQRLKVR